VLWVLHYNEPLLEGVRSPIPLWQCCLHALYFGVVYHWMKEQIVLPVHLERYQNLNRRYHSKQLGRSTSRFYEYLRTPWFLDAVPITDLLLVTRKAGDYGRYLLPAAHLLNLPYEILKQAREAKHSFLDKRRILRHD
jgi:hypothetical protein